MHRSLGPWSWVAASAIAHDCYEVSQSINCGMYALTEPIRSVEARLWIDVTCNTKVSHVPVLPATSH